MAEGKVIIVNPDMFGKDPDSKTTKANEVAKSFGLSDAALAEVEDFKAQLTKHDAWDLPFMGYVNEDGYGYAYVPGAAVVCTTRTGTPTKHSWRCLRTCRPHSPFVCCSRTVRSTAMAPACSCITSVAST